MGTLSHRNVMEGFHLKTVLMLFNMAFMPYLFHVSSNANSLHLEHYAMFCAFV